MSHRFLQLFVGILIVVQGVALPCFSQELAPIKLPTPITEGGKPLMEVLKARASAREYSADTIPAQTLANLLWAAWGINRPDGRRTAPSASNRQEIDIYVVLPEAAYLWDAKANALNPIAAGDHRPETGSRPYIQNAPLNLIYVADKKKANRSPTDPQQIVNIGADTGFISQNVYLFCTSEGLSTVVRAGFERESLAKTLNLSESQLIVLAQTVGFPKK